MTGIGNDRAVFHVLAMLERDDVLAARDRHENITDRGSVHHRHDLITVHHGLECTDGVDLGHDDLGAESLRAQRNALAAPAIAAHDHILARNDKVRRAHDAVPHGLTGAVAVIKQMLAVGIVDHDHREAQRPGTIHDAQAVDAGRRLLTAADDLRDEVRELRVHQMHQITAVINDDVRGDGEYAAQMRLILLVRAAVDSVHIHPLGRQCRSNIVLRRQRIRAGDVHLSTAHFEHTAEIRGLSLQMHGQRDLETGKRLLACKIAADVAQNRHMCFYPADLPLSGFRKVQIFDRAHKATSR